MGRIDRLEHRSRVALSTVSQSGSNLLAAVLGVVGIHEATGALGPSAYGRFVTVVSFVTLFSILNDLGISAVGPRELARAPERARTILGDNLALRTTLSICLIPIVVGVGLLVYPDRRSDIGLGIALMSVDLLLTAIQTTGLTFYASRVRNDVAAMIILLGKCTYVGLIFVASAAHLSFLGYLAAYLAGDLLSTAVLMVLLLRRLRPRLRFAPTAWRAMIAGSFTLGVVQVMATIYYYNATLMLSLFKSPADVAFFGLSVNVLLILGSTSVFFVTALVPAMSTTDAAGIRDILQTASSFLLVLALPIAIGGFLMRQTLVVAFAGPRFAQAELPFGLLLIATAMTFGINMFGVAAVAIDRPGAMIRAQLPLLVINIGLGLILVPQLGTTGAAATLLTSEALSLVAIGWRFAKDAGIRLRAGRTWRVALASATLVPMNLLTRSVWIHDSPIVAALIGISILGCAYGIVLTVVGGMPPELVSFVMSPVKRRRQTAI